jgi:hypothetical protein
MRVQQHLPMILMVARIEYVTNVAIHALSVKITSVVRTITNNARAVCSSNCHRIMLDEVMPCSFFF